MTDPIAPSISKTDLAYRVIREGILAGRFGPGYRLVIDSLAREFGFSQPPVREAIRRLEAEGWVAFERHIGAHVAPLNRSEWIDTMEVLARLEAQATAASAPLLGDEAIARARACNSAMEACLTGLDPVRAQDLNRDFHALLCEACPNEYLLTIVRAAWDRLDAMRRSVFIYMPARWPRVIAEHEAIIDTIIEGAPVDEIERIAREHKLDTISDFRKEQVREMDAPT